MKAATVPSLWSSSGAGAATWSAGRIAEAAAIAVRGIAVAGGSEMLAAALPVEVSADIAMFLGRTDETVARYRRHVALRHARANRCRPCSPSWPPPTP